ncbi:hypothetical protein LRAMOSA09055 [Lichtheimia ramosa]|uniref:Uncharacterized protein n=1 Tax=Lichtheimia ramosa TaxID=688394 RepID=A0A077WIV7_9FUNG|nr:hypothetical protein LRAMOSA09055 [Lichtheimia ramosa]
MRITSTFSLLAAICMIGVSATGEPTTDETAAGEAAFRAFLDASNGNGDPNARLQQANDQNPDPDGWKAFMQTHQVSHMCADTNKNRQEECLKNFLGKDVMVDNVPPSL